MARELKSWRTMTWKREHRKLHREVSDLLPVLDAVTDVTHVNPESLAPRQAQPTPSRSMHCGRCGWHEFALLCCLNSWEGIY